MDKKTYLETCIRFKDKDSMDIAYEYVQKHIQMVFNQVALMNLEYRKN